MYNVLTKAAGVFYLCVLSTFVIFIYFSITSSNWKHIDLQIMSTEQQRQINKILESSENYDIDVSTEINKRYNIIFWTKPQIWPTSNFKEGNTALKDIKCSYTNCYVTSNRSLLNNDIKNFDVVVFLGCGLGSYSADRLPKERSPKQKYVFREMESSRNCPICNKIFNNFFNWTWTYKLDSDERWGYVAIRDINGSIVGPKKEMHWVTDMKPISDELKESLKTKTKAVAWFVSNCHTLSNRSNVAKELDKELSKYNYHVDIYGACGNLRCPRDKDDECKKMLKRDYYFYLSFENSYSEDYVTEKLVTPLVSDTVPIVYGYANYTRFIPDGMYLNAMTSSPSDLAAAILEAIENPKIYHNYFRWKNYYRYQGAASDPDTNELCSVCGKLNNRTAIKTKSSYVNFLEWWNIKYRKIC